jgi:outer membrane biosynthesis protein TonB
MDSGLQHSEQRLGLAAAIAFHAALLALLVFNPVSAPVTPPPERMQVTLAEDAGPVSTAPEPQPAPAPQAAPVIGEVPEPAQQPVQTAEPQVLLRVKPEAAPAPEKVPAPKPLPRVTPVPAQAAPHTAQRIIPKPGGASRIGNDFLQGVANAPARAANANPPAAAISTAVRSSLLGVVSRALKPRWAAPQGAEADRLVTFVTWNLNADGSLAGTPRVVRQEGITDANRAQAARHAEQAVRAIQLAAPFPLPAEYHDAWKRIVEFRFDRKLSQ